MSSNLSNLFDYSRSQLVDYLASLGEKSFRAEQIFKWIHQQGITDFHLMSNLSKSLREKLSQHAECVPPEVVFDTLSDDGTQKWLLKLSCGNCIETVYIPESGRGTLCVSSQVGCALNCSFCSTAKQGFNRNLSTGEIISQLWVAVRRLSQAGGAHDKRVTNIVMMGMGEPLLNFDNVVAAMDIMMDDYAYGLSKRRVTLSTSGVIPAMEALKKVSPVSLAVSLHAPNDALRDVLVPINKKYPLTDLMRVCQSYFENEPRRKVTFEYVMLAGINDGLSHAKELVQCLQGVPAKLNLIPFNPFPGTDYRCSSQTTINKFRDYLIVKGINTITRKTRGDDIDAACGQLAGKVNDRTKRSQRWQAIRLQKTADAL